MLSYKTIIVSGFTEIPPYELEIGDSHLEMFQSYLKKKNYKRVDGSDKVSIAYLNPNTLYPNLSFSFDEAGNLERTLKDSTVIEIYRT
jgi:hypothetical protein